MTDVVAAAPYLVGFHPTESIVMICVHNGGFAGSMRFDLPAAGAGNNRNAARYIVAQVAKHAGEVVVLIYTDAPDGSEITAGTADPRPVRSAALQRSHPPRRPVRGRAEYRLVTEVSRQLKAARVTELDAGLVRQGRWISYYNGDLTDPGIEVPGPENPLAHGLAAEQALRGERTLDSREELVASIAGPGGSVAARRRDLIHRTDSRAQCLDGGRSSEEASATDVEGTTDAVVVCLEHAVDLVGHGRRIDDRMNAWIVAGLTDHAVRDEVLNWCLRNRDTRLLAVLVRLVAWTPDPHAAQVSSILAFLAYRCGNGALAQIALDRVFANEPRHRLATLMQQFLSTAPLPAELDRLIEDDAATREDTSCRRVNRDRAG